MQCCGTPFKVGDNVIWLVSPHCDNHDYNYDGIGDFDSHYNEHADDDEEVFKLNGIVTDIKLVCTIYELRPYEDNDGKVRECYYPVKHKLVDFNGTADGWTEHTDNGYEFSAYLVQVECEK